MPCADCNVNFCIPNNTKMTTITQRRIASRRYDPPPFSATLRDAFMWVTPSFRLISAGAQERVRYSLYAPGTPSLRSPTVPRLTMMCMLGKHFGGAVKLHAPIRSKSRPSASVVEHGDLRESGDRGRTGGFSETAGDGADQRRPGARDHRRAGLTLSCPGRGAALLQRCSAEPGPICVKSRWIPGLQRNTIACRRRA